MGFPAIGMEAMYRNPRLGKRGRARVRVYERALSRGIMSVCVHFLFCCVARLPGFSWRAVMLYSNRMLLVQVW